MRKGPLPTLPYFPQRPFLALVKLCFANRTLPNARTASRLTVRKAFSLLEACKNPRQGVSKMSLPDAVRACPMPFCPAPPFSPGHLSFPGPHLPGSPPPTAAPWGADSCGPAPRDSSLLRNFPLKIPPAVSRPPREVLLSEASSHPVPPAHSALVWEPRSPTSMSAAVAPAAVHPDSMLSEAEEPKEVATDVFNSKNLAVQAQKKILGKMVSKSIATTLIDDTSSEVLDELYRVTKEYTQNKKEAERVIKNLIKTVIKLAVLHRNNQFNQDELALMEKFKKKVHQLAMTVVSFHQVEYTFDRNVLSRLLNECRELLHDIIQRHLTAKSHGRVNNVFDHFSDCDFLAALYNPFGKFKPHLQKLCDGINKMLDEENI